MDRLEKIYEEFGVMMNEDRIYEDETVSYEDICRGLGVAPSALDGILYRIGDSKLSALGKGCEGAVADVDYRIRSRFDVAITAGECSCGRKSGKRRGGE